MNEKTDLTNFFLAWKRTCSVRLCTAQHDKALREACKEDKHLGDAVEEIESLADEVIRSSNADFIKVLSGCAATSNRRSIFENEIDGWRNGVGSAFELLEGYLYAKESLKGKAFKSYLFEDIAVRKGGINKNLYGYLERIWRTMARESFGENVYEPSLDDGGNPIEPSQISYDGKHLATGSFTPSDQMEVKEAVLRFCEFLEIESSEWSADQWIVLFCILNMIPIGGQRLKPLYAKGHDTINTMGQRIRSSLLSFMREKCADLAIARALNGRIQEIVDEKMRGIPVFAQLVEIREENRKSTGK